MLSNDYSVDFNTILTTIARMQKGFSFIELVFVLVIIGIMAAIAYPSYSNLLIRAHRLDGQMALLNLAQHLEQHYAIAHDYRTATGTPLVSPSGWYALKIHLASKNHYELHAIPTGTQASTDSTCHTLTLDSRGIQGNLANGVSTPVSLTNTCWH